MSEIPKNFIKFTAEVILLLVILITVFGTNGDGVFTNTIDYMTYAKPIVLQNAVARSISVASYTPGDFAITFETTARDRLIFGNGTAGIYTVEILPAEERKIKTDYTGLQKITVATNCIITPPEIEVPEGFITLTKTETPDGCEIVIA